MNTHNPKFGSIDKLRSVVAVSRSMSEVARTFGYKDAGGTVAHLRRLCLINGIDVSHFLGMAWAKGKTYHDDNSLKRYRQDWNKIFRLGSKVQNSTLMRRLIESGKKVYKCDICGCQNWQGKPIRLQLEHINGNCVDNREENLSFLCPNCHSQTKTFSRGTRDAGSSSNTMWWKNFSGCGETEDAPCSDHGE